MPCHLETVCRTAHWSLASHWKRTALGFRVSLGFISFVGWLIWVLTFQIHRPNVHWTFTSHRWKSRAHQNACTFLKCPFGSGTANLAVLKHFLPDRNTLDKTTRHATSFEKLLLGAFSGKNQSSAVKSKKRARKTRPGLPWPWAGNKTCPPPG